MQHWLNYNQMPRLKVGKSGDVQTEAEIKEPRPLCMVRRKLASSAREQQSVAYVILVTAQQTYGIYRLTASSRGKQQYLSYAWQVQLAHLHHGAAQRQL